MLFIGNLGTGEIIVILIVALVVVGPSRLPQMAKKFGRWFRDIKKTGESIKMKIEEELYKEDDEYEEFSEKIEQLKEEAKEEPANSSQNTQESQEDLPKEKNGKPEPKSETKS